jgi:hypothetical protein
VATIDEKLDPPGRDHQQILNSDWPKYPTNFVERPPMPVWVRIEWRVTASSGVSRRGRSVEQVVRPSHVHR